MFIIISMNNAGKFLLLGCVVLLCLCCCATVGAGALFYGTFNAGISAATRGNVIAKLCNTESASFSNDFKTLTTAEFRRNTSEIEFRQFVNAFGSYFCDDADFESTSFASIANGVKLDYSNNNGQEVLQLTKTVKAKAVLVELRSEEGVMKLHGISID